MQMPKIKVYTIHCRNCNVLTAKLKDKKIEFEEIDDISVMESLGIDDKPMPLMQIDDGPFLKFGDAVKYVNQMEVPNT